MMKLEIVTPFGVALTASCQELAAPGALGQFGVLPEHIPFLTAVPPGIVWFRDERGAVKYMAVSNGYAEVSDEGVVLLVETAERAEDIDLTRAKANRDRFKPQVDAWQGAMDEPAIHSLLTRLKREEARIEAVESLKS